MITRISSDLKTFKPLTFRAGLNILLAERHEEATARDTRNGTGKTSLIELIHFLVQDRKSPDDDFHKVELVGSTFGAEFLDEGRKYTIRRRTGPGKEKDQAFFNSEPVDAKELRQRLALDWFGLSAEELAEPYGPKFGALLAYFVRKERNGGFANPALNASVQQTWDSQVNLAYLLGFDWKLIQRLQLLKDEKKAADSLSGIIKGGFFSGDTLDLNKMQSRLDVLESEVKVKRHEIAQLRVVDGYRQHEEAANTYTRQIRELNEANLEDLDLREAIQSALEEIADIRENDIKSVYEQAGVYFSDQVKKRFDQVLQFHRTVAQNRKSQLEKEDERAKIRLQQRRVEIDIAQKRLQESLTVLKSGVALERLSHLQSELNYLDGELSDLRQQIPRLREIEDTRLRLKREIDEQVELIGQDVQSREDARKSAVQSFARVSRHLYDEPGNLILGRSRGVSGLEIDTDILGKKSGGKSHMQIFCFDWVIAETAKRQDRSPGFLVHDSHIFDGVDGRQIGLALDFASQRCRELGIQYIVAMNSDDLQKVKAEEAASGEPIFDPTEYLLETRLNDSESGGIFGIRF